MLPSVAWATPSSRVRAVSDYKILSGEHLVSGAQTALIVLIEFPDVHHTQSADAVERVALEQLNSYYTEVSYGKVSIGGKVFGWYTAPHPMGYYGHDSKNPGDDDNLEQLARDAVTLLPSSFNASSLNFLVIIHAGKDQSADQADVKSDEIWSQCYCSVFPYYKEPDSVYANGKSFTNYAFLSEFNGVGTFAHEWGHLFGLPDLYDTESKDSYIGYWSLMDSGNWCCFNSNQGTPSEIGGWGDVLLGWLLPTVADSNVLLSAFDLKPIESAQPSSILIPVSPSTYYFVEYRTKSGSDSYLPNSGILVYFVNENLDTGRGILRLVDPSSGKVLKANGEAEGFDDVVFKASDEFRDALDRVYVAFVGGSDSLTTLFSTQEFAGSFMRTNLQTSPMSLAGMFSDQVSISATLLTENGLPLGGQAVEADILDQFHGQWRRIGVGTTDQLGGVTIVTTLSDDAGNHALRLFYPGGKSESVWYTSSAVEISVQILPARMTLTVSPTIVIVGKASIDISVTGLHGEPLSGVEVVVYVGNQNAGSARTDDSGRANLILQFGPGDLGLRTISVKADMSNYQPAQTSENSVLLPIWLIAAIVAAAIALFGVFVWLRRRKGA